MAPVAKSGILEKLPSSQVKWGTSGWKKRHLVAKSMTGQVRRSQCPHAATGPLHHECVRGARKEGWEGVSPGAHGPAR